LLAKRIPSYFSRFIELNIKPNSTFELLYVQPNLQFGCEKSREFTIPTAKKIRNAKRTTSMRNILSHSDKASCKLAVFDAAEFLRPFGSKRP
jgi:hypothetical protein